MTGRPVRVIFTKWGGGRHWEFDNVVLGRDERGTWLGGPAGRVMTRPGTTVTLRHDSVLLVPDGQPYAATFNRAGNVVPGCAVYVDVTTPAQWGEGAGVGVVRLVDLDLDVVRRWDGSVLVEDEDEFAEHQVALGYPPEIVALAERSRDQIRRALEAGEPPYDGRGEVWLDRLADWVKRSR